jgi:uncharacterized protein
MPSEAPLISSLLIKPAGPDCNLACGYCFYRPAAGLYPRIPHPRMTTEVLRAVVSQYMPLSDTPAFCWQGGEPTLMGLDFFRAVVALQQQLGRRGQVVGNSLQTNGVLIEDEWARFLARYHFLVGISLDGPAEIHDHYRRSRRGEPTLDQVLAGLRTLQRHQVEVNALCMVTPRSAGRGREVVEFLRELGLEYLQFIPCVEKSPTTGQLREYGLRPEQYGEFLCEVFDLWLAADRSFQVRIFDDLLCAELGLDHLRSCEFRSRCGDYVVVEHNGDVYCCDFFVDEAHKLGNLTRQPLTELVARPEFAAFAAAKGDYGGDCLGCQWLYLCHGGCQRHRIFAGDCVQSPSYLCAGLQRFYAHALPRLAPVVAELRHQTQQQALQRAAEEEANHE